MKNKPKPTNGQQLVFQMWLQKQIEDSAKETFKRQLQEKYGSTLSKQTPN